MKVWWIIFAIGVASVMAAEAAKPPSAAEQANYVALQQTVISALNTYRASQNVGPVTGLPVLAQASREAAEADLFGTTAVDVFTRATALGYQGAFGGVVLGYGYLTPSQFIAGISANASLVGYLKDPASKYVGVGLALNAAGPQSDTQWYLLFGQDSTNPSFPPPYGTVGVETGSGRGVPDLSNIAAIYSGAVLGNSIEGFISTNLPDPETLKVTAIVQKLLKKPLKASVKIGGSVGVKLPAPLVKAAKIKVKGKLPKGVKFKKGKLSGQPETPGSYTVRLQVTLPFAIEGKQTLILKVVLSVE